MFDWLKKACGGSVVPPTEVDRELYEKRSEATQAVEIGRAYLDHARSVSSRSEKVNKRMRVLREQNHFAELMLRAMGGQP